MTTPTIPPRPVWPVRAGLAGAALAVLAVAAPWLGGLDADVDGTGNWPGGWLLIVAGTTGWLAATLAGCFGPLPAGATRNLVLDGAMLLSTVSVLVLAAGVIIATAGLH